MKKTYIKHPENHSLDDLLKGVAVVETKIEDDYDENGLNSQGFYKDIDSYYSAHKDDKYNYGKEIIPHIFVAKKSSMSVRRGAFIHAYVGPNGGGKSLSMIHDTIQTLNGVLYTCSERAHHHAHPVIRTYRKVLSSVRLIDPRTGEDHPLWIPLNDHRQLFFFYHGDILLDEVTGLASQDESFQLPIQIKNMFAQLRRRDVFLRWTTPNWTTAAKAVRNVTRAVTYCKGYLAVFDEGQSWPSNTFFIWKTYDAQNFEYFNVGTRDRLTPITFQSYFRPRKKNLADKVYDTYSVVLTAGASNDAGLCMHCGGRRSTPRCNCQDRDFLDSEANLQKLGAEVFAKVSDKVDSLSALPDGEEADLSEHQHFHFSAPLIRNFEEKY